MLIPAVLSIFRSLVAVIILAARSDLSEVGYNDEIKRGTALYAGSRILILMNIPTLKVDQR
jgi:hypothetical protein